jgi:hypothetical protein
LADYAETTWVDDDGSGTVGTEFTADRMNNIEDGITDGRVKAITFADFLAAPYTPADSNNKGWIIRVTNVPSIGLYMSDGTAWINIAAGSDSSNFTPARTTLFERQGKLPASATNQAYILGAQNTAANNYAMLPSTGNVADGAPSDFAPIYFEPTDYALPNRTLSLRIRAAVLSNATSPAATFQFGLYPITNAGGASALAYTLGTLVSGTNLTVANPGASSWAVQSGTAQSGITAGRYVIAVIPSTTVAANSRVKCIAMLQATWA